VEETKTVATTICITILQMSRTATKTCEVATKAGWMSALARATTSATTISEILQQELAFRLGNRT